MKEEVLLYENYKEPLRKVSDEKGEGFGYMGTLAMNKEKTHVQCHICGKLFKSMSWHLRNVHGITALEYKEEFGLDRTTALIGETIRRGMQEKAIQRANGLPKHLEGFNARRKSGELKKKGYKMSLEQRNKRGICPDQVLEKILELKEKLGKTPGMDDFHDEYRGRYMAPIKTIYGSYSNAVKKLGLQTRDELRHPNKEKLIQDLIDFQKLNKRIPMTSDFNRGLLRDKGVYIRQFGTLNNARLEAGMNAVIPMPFGQIKELTPDQYIKYKNGHLTENMLPRSVYRKKLRAIKARQKLQSSLA